MQGRGERSRGHRVLDEREPLPLRAVDDEPDADAAEEPGRAFFRINDLDCSGFHDEYLAAELVCRLAAAAADRSAAGSGARSSQGTVKAPSRCAGHSALRSAAHPAPSPLRMSV